MYSFGFRPTLHYFLFALVFPSLADSADLAEIKAAHDRATQNLFMKYECTRTETDQYDPARYDQFARFTEKASAGKLPDGITPDEVKAWYEFISLPERTYNMRLTFRTKSDCMRVFKEAPKGTSRLWTSAEEYIVNPNRNGMFWVDHKEKLIDLYYLFEEETGSQHIRYLYFNPSSLLFPLSSMDKIDSVTMESHGDLIRLSWNNPDSNAELSSIQAELDPSNGYVSRKSLIKINTKTSPCLHGFYMENEDFVGLEGVTVPRQSRVLLFSQFKADEPEGTKIEGMKVVKHSDYNTLDSIDAKTFSDFNSRFVLTLDTITFSTREIDEDTFWPASPAGYKHADYRYMALINSVLLNPEGRKKELERLEKMSAGTDSHTFPFSIEE